MLNTCLTVRPGKPGSHSGKGWEQFTDKVLDVVDRYGGANLPSGGGVGRGVVFMAWGSFAEKRVAKLNKVRVLYILRCSSAGIEHVVKTRRWIFDVYCTDFLMLYSWIFGFD